MISVALDVAGPPSGAAYALALVRALGGGTHVLKQNSVCVPPVPCSSDSVSVRFLRGAGKKSWYGLYVSGGCLAARNFSEDALGLDLLSVASNGKTYTVILVRDEPAMKYWEFLSRRARGAPPGTFVGTRDGCPIVRAAPELVSLLGLLGKRWDPRHPDLYDDSITGITGVTATEVC